MLVYGDAHFGGRLQALRRNLLALAAHTPPHDLDALRALLIACGQVEQAGHDALAALAPTDAAPLIACLHAATAHAADAFYALAWQQAVPLPPPLVAPPDALHAFSTALARLERVSDLPVTVKVPEGFNLHGLYPEQYLLAAGDWLAAHEGQRACGATIVGVRSIGTTLAAVVGSVLRAGGWRVQSFTVRPTGHPFDRSVDLAGARLDSGSLALVVDEGPGISGSSLAATAAALVQAGFAPDAIAFLPGHANDPGGMGSADVQAWWRTAPRYVGAAETLRFGGLTLEETLAAAQVTAQPTPGAAWQNLSGGVWRQHVYATPEEWPPVATAFERIKRRAVFSDGWQVLWKYLGLAAGSPDLVSTAEAAARLLEQRAAHSLATPPLSVRLGYVATPWLAGSPLTAATATPAHVEQMGAYIARVAGPEVAGGELSAATDRLAEMLAVNTQEALGDVAAARAQALPRPTATPQPCYGDGHLHPHEWLATPAGRLLKVDGVGHDADHTLVGRQPVAWDVAGALVEWGLDGSGGLRLLQAYTAAGGSSIDAPALAFYRAAYLAFRAGQCALAAQHHDPNERDRLTRAYMHYRAQLAAQLGVPVPA